jgi:hypothetical protein
VAVPELGITAGSIRVVNEAGVVECLQGDDEEIAEKAEGVDSTITRDWSVFGLLVHAIARYVGNEADRIDRDDADETTGTKADIVWQIDTPLQPGGHVTHCCIRNRNQGDVPCTDAVNEPSFCWSTDAPEGYLPCCL